MAGSERVKELSSFEKASQEPPCCGYSSLPGLSESLGNVSNKNICYLSFANAPCRILQAAVLVAMEESFGIPSNLLKGVRMQH
jgi:hypothetical protein